VLWTQLGCVDADKTLVYLKRAGSSPVNLSLRRDDDLPPHDPFFQIVPHTIQRLKSLHLWGTPEGLQSVIDQLSSPAPLLEGMSITGTGNFKAEGPPTLMSALFGGDLSSLSELHLQKVRIELPWRNMVSLTSFRLHGVSPVSMGQLLDFFEGAPRLREVHLHFKTPTFSDQTGRLVSLACLKKMSIYGGPSSVLLEHLLIPVGTLLGAEVELPSPPIRDHPPRFFDNLRILPGFTAVQLVGGRCPHMGFSGPNGEVRMTLSTPPDDGTCLVLESLTNFDTQKTERLEIEFMHSPPSYPPCRVLLPMKDLRTLTLHNCTNTCVFVHALDPNVGSLGALLCPKLEELIIGDEGKLDIKIVVGMAAARESRGAGLKSIRIVNLQGPAYAQLDVSELAKHVPHLEC